MLQLPATLPRFVDGRTKGSARRPGRSRPTAGPARPGRATGPGCGAAPARLLVAGAALALAWVAVRRSAHRVVVSGTSMAPALQPGDRLVVVSVPWVRQPWPRPGDVVAVRDPRQASRLLVKRVASVRPDAGTLEVAGDAREHSTDSRAFGPVPRSSIVGRAVYRYAPVGRSGRGPWPEEYHRA
jgi:nickel-type superoxide dismutase maturation protease